MDYLELGISFGNVYDLGNKLQLVYGGSVGNWLVTWGEPCGYKSYHDAVYYAQNNFVCLLNYARILLNLRTEDFWDIRMWVMILWRLVVGLLLMVKAAWDMEVVDIAAMPSTITTN